MIWHSLAFLFLLLAAKDSHTNYYFFWETDYPKPVANTIHKSKAYKFAVFMTYQTRAEKKKCIS